jgi:thiol:disulfide interchange protein
MAWGKTLIGLAALLATDGVAAAAPAVPVLSEASVPAAHHPYDEDADAHQALAAALAEAQHDGRKVLIDFGANWCADCRALAGVLDVPAVRQWTDGQFVIVSIDVGHFNKNLDIAKSYGLEVKAIPAVIVADAAGKPLNLAESEALGDARSMSPQAVVDLLARWSAANQAG